ncbi:MAG: hypothetical protein AAFX45_14100 [Pseudomonadota bacterium]
MPLLSFGFNRFGCFGGLSMRRETNSHGDEGDGATVPHRKAELRAIIAMLEFAAERARDVGAKTVGGDIDRLVRSVKRDLEAGE